MSGIGWVLGAATAVVVAGRCWRAAGRVRSGRSTRDRPGVRESRMQYDNDENMKQSAGSAMYSQADSLLV